MTIAPARTSTMHIRQFSDHEQLSQPTRSQSGSAYIVTVLVLLILTVMGLSLVFIAQTENIVGSQERTIQRVFYAADAGIHSVLIKLLKNAAPDDPLNESLDFKDPVGAGVLMNRVTTIQPFPLHIGDCNLCSINSGQPLNRINFLLLARAERLAGNNDVPIAVKQIEQMSDIQPLPFQGVRGTELVLESLRQGASFE
jgi:hypothetical protein